jgi:hypothetical protein
LIQLETVDSNMASDRDISDGSRMGVRHEY